MTMLIWVAVALLGGVGAVLRFVVDGRVSARLGRTLPYGTLVVNVSGSIALGLLAGLALSHEAALLAGTAMVGAYTTFSTWMLETQRLGEDRRAAMVVANILVSLVLGVAAAALGRMIGARL